ncbi:MAG TPA: hypothetical protein VND90_03470 [Terracidiphilus sp.]|nr:hypothetical protein [Terracidiphilus sp.]
MMPKWTIFDYVDPVEGNLFKAWSSCLQKKELAKLNNRLDALSTHGPELIPGILSPTGLASIFKLKIHGNVQLRPLLCEGPGRGEEAFTLLLGAFEVSNDYVPIGAPLIASRMRESLIKDMRRRVIHERVG